jgi:hypothetical protein
MMSSLFAEAKNHPKNHPVSMCVMCSIRRPRISNRHFEHLVSVLRLGAAAKRTARQTARRLQVSQV